MISSGAVVLRDEHGHLVIEKPNYRDHWLLPGGGVDPGEDARLCAQREVHEELGLDVEVGRMLAVDWLPSHVVRSAPMGVHFLFDAGVIPAARLEAEVVPQAEELDDWALVEEDQLDLLGLGRRLHPSRAQVLRGEITDLVSPRLLTRRARARVPRLETGRAGEECNASRPPLFLTVTRSPARVQTTAPRDVIPASQAGCRGSLMAHSRPRCASRRPHRRRRP